MTREKMKHIECWSIQPKATDLGHDACELTPAWFTPQATFFSANYPPKAGDQS